MTKESHWSEPLGDTNTSLRQTVASESAPVLPHVPRVSVPLKRIVLPVYRSVALDPLV